MSTLASLLIELGIDTGRLQGDLGKASRQVDTAFDSMSRSASRLGAVFGALTTGAVALGLQRASQAAMEGEQAINRLDAVILATGNASGFTSRELHALADAMAETTQFDDESIRGATASLLRFGNIHGKVLTEALKLSADYAAFTGTDMTSASEALGRAIASPAQGIERLQRAIGYLNPAQVEAIKNMQEMGDLAGAQSAILDILKRKIGGTAEIMNTGYTKAVNDAKKATGEFWETLGNAGPVQSATQSFLGFVTTSMRDLKHIVEDGDWVQAVKFLLGFRQSNEQVAARRPPGLPSATDSARAYQEELARGSAFRKALDEQDQRAVAGQLARQKKAQDELARENERYRQMDAAGWVAHIEAGEREYEDGLRAQAKLAEEFYDTQDELRKMDLEGQEWLSKNVVRIVAEENKQIAALERLAHEARIQEWRHYGDIIAGGFTSMFEGLLDGTLTKWSDFARSLANIFKRVVVDFVGSAIRGMMNNLMTQMAGSAGGGGFSMSSLMGGVNPLALAFAGGSIAGSAITGWLGSGPRGQQVGTMAGGAGATLGFMVGGPVGAVIGAALGSAIGHFTDPDGPAQRAATFGPTAGATGLTSYTYNSPFGSFGLSNTDWFSDADMGEGLSQWASGMGQWERQVAGFLTPEETARVTAALSTSEQRYGFGTEHTDFGSTLSQMTTDRAREIVAAIDPVLGELVDGFEGTGQEMAQFVLSLLGMRQALSQMNITGLNMETLQLMGRAGETLEQTFQRVAGTWSWFQQNFYTDAERLEMAQNDVNRVFADLGIAVPGSITEFRELVNGIDLSTEAGRTLWNTLMAVAPAFLLVEQSADGATDAITDTNEALAEQAELQRRIGEAVREGRERQLDAIIGARGGLQDWLNRTLLDTGVTTLTPQERLAEAQRQYEEVLLMARGGDLTAAGRLGGVADAYLRIARELYASGSSYVDIFDRVTGGVRSVDDRLAIDQQMLEATLGMSLTLSDIKSLLIEIRDDGRAVGIKGSVEKVR